MKKLAKILVGSHMFGLETENSDKDYVEIFKEDNNKLLGFDYKEEIQVDKDYRQYEVGKFLRLCMKANPNMLDILFCAPKSIIESSPEFEYIRQHRFKFLTKECKDTYGRYAISQIRKATGYNKKSNWEKDRIERKDLLDFGYFIPEGTSTVLPIKKWLANEGYDQRHCGLSKIPHIKDCYFLYIDTRKWYNEGNHRFDKVEEFGYKGLIKDGYQSNEVSLSSIPGYAISSGILYINHNGYSTHCKDYNSYIEWLSKRNEERFITNKKHNQQYDSKNISHCRRLLNVAMEIPVLHDIKVERADKDYLLQIKTGEINLKDIIDQSEKDILKLDELYNTSTLPDTCNADFINQLLIKIRKWE